MARTLKNRRCRMHGVLEFYLCRSCHCGKCPKCLPVKNNLCPACRLKLDHT